MTTDFLEEAKLLEQLKKNPAEVRRFSVAEPPTVQQVQQELRTTLNNDQKTHMEDLSSVYTKNNAFIAHTKNVANDLDLVKTKLELQMQGELEN